MPAIASFMRHLPSLRPATVALLCLPATGLTTDAVRGAQETHTDRPRMTRHAESTIASVQPRHWQSQVVRLHRPVLVPQLPLPGEAVARFSIDDRNGDFRIWLLIRDLELPFAADMRTSAHDAEDRIITSLSTSPQRAEVPLSPILGGKRVEGRLTGLELAAYHDSHLVVHIEFLRAPMPPMRARLSPLSTNYNTSHTP